MSASREERTLKILKMARSAFADSDDDSGMFGIIDGFLKEIESDEIRVELNKIAARETGPGSWIPEVIGLLESRGIIRSGWQSLA